MPSGAAKEFVAELCEEGGWIAKQTTARNAKADISTLQKESDNLIATYDEDGMAIQVDRSSLYIRGRSSFSTISSL